MISKIAPAECPTPRSLSQRCKMSWAVQTEPGGPKAAVMVSSTLQPKWLQEIHHHLVRSSRLKIGFSFLGSLYVVPTKRDGNEFVPSKFLDSFVGAWSFNRWCQPISAILANATASLPPPDLDDRVGPKECLQDPTSNFPMSKWIVVASFTILHYPLPEPVPGRPWPA